MSENKLLPCPFCGGEARLESNGQYAVVGCVNSNCQGYACCYKYNSKKEAIEHWNTRKPMERIVERLEEARAECKELQRTTTDAYGYMKMKQGIDCAKDIVKEEGGIE